MQRLYRMGNEFQSGLECMCFLSAGFAHQARTERQRWPVSKVETRSTEGVGGVTLKEQSDYNQPTVLLISLFFSFLCHLELTQPVFSVPVPSTHKHRLSMNQINH